MNKYTKFTLDLIVSGFFAGILTVGCIGFNRYISAPWTCPTKTARNLLQEIRCDRSNEGILAGILFGISFPASCIIVAYNRQ